MKLYSPTTKGFYDSGIHKKIPEDAIVISDAVYQDLIRQQAEGKKIVAVGATVVAVERDKPTIEQQQAAARRRRDRELTNTDWLASRHREELDAKRPTTLTDKQYAALLAYRQDLRDLPADPAWPNATFVSWSP